MAAAERQAGLDLADLEALRALAERARAAVGAAERALAEREYRERRARRSATGIMAMLRCARLVLDGVAFEVKRAVVERGWVWDSDVDEGDVVDITTGEVTDEAAEKLELLEELVRLWRRAKRAGAAPGWLDDFVRRFRESHCSGELPEIEVHPTSAQAVHEAYKEAIKEHMLYELEQPVLVHYNPVAGEFTAYYKGGIVVVAGRRGVEVRPCAALEELARARG